MVELRGVGNLFRGRSANQGAHVEPVEPDRFTGESEQAKASQMPYSSDHPIQSREEDKFNRWPFAKRIADTLVERSDPQSLVIGIYGPWGDGKTSTLRLMRDSLTEHQDVVTVDFNPWLFGSDEQLLRGFFATLAAAIGKVLPTKKEQLGKALEDYGALLSPIGALLPGLGEAAKGLGRALSTVELDELRKRLESLLRETGKRIVILIEDIDRLDRREIQAVFKLVKLSASFDFTSYVLAFDDQMVAASLGESYGAGGASAGRSFLEKIVQVPLHLPPPDDLALRDLALAGVAEALRSSDITLSHGHIQAFLQHFLQGLAPMLETPRQAKLYANALMFALPLLKGEANPVDHLLIEGVRVLYPSLYVAIRDNPELFVNRDHDQGLKLRVENCINAALEADKASDAEHVRRALVNVLFPGLEGLLGGSHYGPEWETRWAQEQRICSKEYFHRYFTYGILSNDVSDLAVFNLIDSAKTGIDIQPLLSKFVGHQVIRRVIEKLRLREAEIPVSAISALVLTIARNGALLPHERGPIDWTITQSGLLISNLIQRLPSLGAREELACEVCKVAEPLPFAVECFQSVILPEDQPESNRIVPKTCESELGKILAGRIRDQAAVTPPYRQFPSAPRLLWVWSQYGSKGEVCHYLRARLEAESTELDDFLATFFPNVRGFVPLAIAHDSYRAVSHLIDPLFILSKLRERYGAEIDAPLREPEGDLPPATRIAREFARLCGTLERCGTA